MADIKTYKSTLTGHQLDEALAKLGQVDSAVQQSEAAAAQAQGYADSINPAGFATASQGKKADTAVQPSDVLNLVYPVGAIYISCNSASPAALFGGSWTQIQGRFLLAADSAHPAGSTGGEETVSLTAEQNGPHQHMGLTVDGASITWTWPAASPGSGTTGTLTTEGSQAPVSGSSGSGAPHNNMPPYLAVYMWQRTA